MSVTNVDGKPARELPAKTPKVEKSGKAENVLLRDCNRNGALFAAPQMAGALSFATIYHKVRATLVRRAGTTREATIDHGANHLPQVTNGVRGDVLVNPVEVESTRHVDFQTQIHQLVFLKRIRVIQTIVASPHPPRKGSR